MLNDIQMGDPPSTISVRGKVYARLQVGRPPDIQNVSASCDFGDFTIEKYDSTEFCIENKVR